MSHFYIIIEKDSGIRVGTKVFIKEFIALNYIALMGRSSDWTTKKINKL